MQIAILLLMALRQMKKNIWKFVKTLKDLSKVKRFLTAVPELRNSKNYFVFSFNKQQQILLEACAVSTPKWKQYVAPESKFQFYFDAYSNYLG